VDRNSGKIVDFQIGGRGFSTYLQNSKIHLQKTDIEILEIDELVTYIKKTFKMV
jgi:hypothetical protein